MPANGDALCFRRAILIVVPSPAKKGCTTSWGKGDIVHISTPRLQDTTFLNASAQVFWETFRPALTTHGL